ncbi:MAG: LysM peptidoglycan-binding domain-containing protein, partial [Candidatus Omnitrophica bacterium]|nr:LysM peptidoglycan-binding domain-containing protein [Candidatus Omnitrophota bacterium]
MQRLKFKFQNFLLITVYGLLISSFFGCATPEKKVSPLTYPEEKPAGKEGVYHRVKRGETLWRIAKLYDVELEKIAQANHLSDTTKIFQGQMIFIPDARHSLSRKDFSGKEFIWPLKGKIVSSFGTKRADG